MIGVLLLAIAALAEDEGPARPSVFELPRRHAAYLRLQPLIQQAFRANEFEKAEQLCAEASKLLPQDPASYYQLARVQAQLGKTDDAIGSLDQVVDLGLTAPRLLSTDPTLASLRDQDRFKQLLKRATAAGPRPSKLWQQQMQPATISSNAAVVGESNTVYDPRTGLLLAYFQPAKLDSTDPKPSPDEPVRGHGEVGELLRKWYAEGTAAGNVGDLYDNHDQDHSNLDYDQFPQLTRIEFDEAVKKQKLQVGLQTRFFYDAVTFGNASVAMTQGPLWRSMPRLAYCDPPSMSLLYRQYAGNHLYVYPEHRDHDPGHNGKDGGGYGDVFCANTPYVIISQGSSGSDRPFLDAIACTLAAFHPAVKQQLAAKGALMPTVQMVFRSCGKQLESPDDYLTGIAHPTVFDGQNIDLLKMVKAVHDLRPDELPPIVSLRVVEEDEAVVGRDYFDTGPREKLFDTPASIARIGRSMKYQRRMVISAEASHDLNDRPLNWHWVVLRGDAERIQIKRLNATGSIAELIVPYHPRRPIRPGADIESNRVDIGVFVHNGKHYSAPAFVTWFFPDNEARVYDDEGRIQSVQYSDVRHGGNYTDPLLQTPKTWLDRYRYDDQHRLIGWTRIRGEHQEQFTADGALVIEADESGRAARARTVEYVAQAGQNEMGALQQQPGDKILRYEYTSGDDRVGRVVETESQGEKCP